MFCMFCDGPVFWEGPITALTHTKCRNCGAINSQVVDPDEEEDAPVEIAQSSADPAEFSLDDLPADVLEAERKLSSYFAERNIKEWKLGRCRSR